MTVQEIINSITHEDIIRAIDSFNFDVFSKRGPKTTEFVSQGDKLYPVKELLLQAKPEIFSASNYSPSSYTTNMAKARLYTLKFNIISTQNQQAKLSMTSYYIKRVLNQDVERSFSISNESAKDFFMLELDNGEEQIVSIYYNNENQIEETVIQKRNTRNEYRFFPKHKENIDEGDILLFENFEDGYTMEVIKLGNRFESLDMLLNGNNHLLTDSLLLKQDNKSIKTIMNNHHPLNQILYGPPGTGKTYNTILKSLSILGIDYNDYEDAIKKFQQELGNRIEFVSMHQSFSYEDFVQGLRPRSINGMVQFDYVDGVFKKICVRANEAITIDRNGENFVIVLDEINRANISKVFGELITLIEEDKREAFTVRLPSGELFSVPNNLYIIGTMNTADKSVSMVDIALRRRFEFEAMYPRPDLVEDKEKRDFMVSLNLAIIEKKGIDFQIGHSDFMKSLDLTTIINRKIIPLLMEYFRNRYEEVTEILKNCLPRSMKIDEELYKLKQVKVLNRG